MYNQICTEHEELNSWRTEIEQENSKSTEQTETDIGQNRRNWTGQWKKLVTTTRTEAATDHITHKRVDKIEIITKNDYQKK